MIGLVFRRLALAVVFAAGIASIMATSPPPPPFHFREVSIEPAWRCPGADVEISWTLSRPAPVRVMVGGVEQVITTANRTTLPAELLEHNAPVAELTLSIDAEDPDVPHTNEINTLDAERMVENLAFHEKNMTFRMNQDGLWDERIRVIGFEVEQVRDLACEGEAVSPPAWEISPPSGAPFLLRAEQGYSGRLDPPLAPGSEWRIRPAGAKCRLPSSGLEPYLSIRLTAVCRQPHKSS